MVATQTADSSSAAKLCRAIDQSDQHLRPFREQRENFIRHILGPQYGGKNRALTGRQPLSLLYSMVSIIEPALSVRELKTDIVVHGHGAQWFANQFANVIDYVADKCNAAGALRKAVRDTLTGMGVVKTGWDAEKNRPYVLNVPLPKYVIDTRASEREPGAYAFEGHWFSMDYEKLMDGDLIDAKGKRIIERCKAGRDQRSEAKDIAITRDAYDPNAYKPQVELFEAYLPDEHELRWLPGDLSAQTGYILEKEQFGPPETSPFDVMGFYWPSDQLIPLPLACVIFDLYQLQNEVANRIARQSRKQKDIVLANLGIERLGEKIDKAADGSVVNTLDANGAKSISIGGPAEKNYQAVAWFNDFYSRIAHNLNMIGGQKGGTKTLGQDQMLMGNTDVAINDMREEVRGVGRGALNKLAWYVWHDPEFQHTLTERVNPSWMPQVLSWQQAKEGQDLNDYQFSVRAYNGGNKAPEQRYQEIVDWIAKVVIPLAPLAPSMGQNLNVAELVKSTGRLLDFDEIDDYWVDGEPQKPAPPDVDNAGGGSGGSGGRQRPQRQSPGGRQPQRPVEGLAMASAGAQKGTA